MGGTCDDVGRWRQRLTIESLFEDRMKPPRSKLRGITRKGIVCETPRFLTLFPLQGNLAASSEESPDLITAEMAEWAHEVRLDANAQRHADRAATRPTGEDARRCIEFALALAEFLFVLPARVKRGRQPATNMQNAKPLEETQKRTFDTTLRFCL